ncbi:hypothetical protein CC1G_01161 [Coprinopsis cinerea okayama7|uniref:Metaxin glutathione S-transferase domain-containing protein n=1 Tax=Coprinopsis cinerea (strain Okayama-7 / 130 / ATCC MYA-4618 / FGSC 9003) TaxID=240176 RepID=A8NEQ7_COPC7|nr:hypothetical protein CC1G_01161 [Coprinopsis cinerea okayama7\|eukprot:XP_001833099.1 hypothetical protein CC1G_01161 [Coprinopsis cinerea okayama7\
MPQPPKPVAAFFSFFPLKTYPPVQIHDENVQNSRPTKPTLWISPPKSSSPASTTAEGTNTETTTNNLLSGDVECLKWQAYIALRGLNSVKVRWDIRPEGALEARLPNLHLPKQDGEKLDADLAPSTEIEKEKKTAENVEHKLHLYSAAMIPSWVDLTLGVDSASDPLEGYINEAARDESRAWVSLLEGVVHGALVLFSQSQPSLLANLLDFGSSTSAVLTSGSNSGAPGQPHPLQTVLSPPPAPLSGFTSILPAFGTRVNPTAIISQYREAIVSLSERLGTDKWFLGSNEPTPLDALAFAYLHCLLASPEALRFEVTKHVNLVAWEWRVREQVRNAFTR